MAIRTALGGGRRRLIRQLLTESVVLAGCGGLQGLVLAGTWLLSHLDAFSIPPLEGLRIDGRTFAFTLALTLLAGLLFGLIPSLQVETLAVHSVLKEGAAAQAAAPVSAGSAAPWWSPRWPSPASSWLGPTSSCAAYCGCSRSMSASVPSG